MTRLEDVISQADALLLDFDGPICRLFAGYPNTRAAKVERDFLSTHGIEVPTESVGTSDPLRLLQWTGTHQPGLIADVEERLLAAERTAARTAAPTVHADRVLKNASESGLGVAVVSNNSAPAVRTYLDMHGLSAYVLAVCGRVPGHPELMKPNPHLVVRASQLLGVRAGRCVLVGDSATDMEAAGSARAGSVGYAKTPDRVAVLKNAGAEVVIEDMAVLADAITNAASRTEQSVWPIT
ncbi:MAG TPA: HAD family phosphatase [Streptosporangiaceae bacterium]